MPHGFAMEDKYETVTANIQNLKSVEGPVDFNEGFNNLLTEDVLLSFIRTNY